LRPVADGPARRGRLGVHPGQLGGVELAAAAQYVANDNQPTPVDRMARRLWGLPVVTSTMMSAGVALLGDWGGSSRLHITQNATIDWSENVGDDFQKNLVRWRCEGRFDLEVSRPFAFVEVDLTA
jgi:HK97 family phage major capsid protein